MSKYLTSYLKYDVRPLYFIAAVMMKLRNHFTCKTNGKIDLLFYKLCTCMPGRGTTGR